MRKQQAIWLAEHTQLTDLPGMADTSPSSGVTKFIDYLRAKNYSLQGKAVDIGAGKGRHSVYLASLGFEVWALEYIEPAIQAARKLATDVSPRGKIHFELTEIDQPWPIDNEVLDLAIDSFSSIDIETRNGRETCRDEMYRTLKPGGVALIMVCSSVDVWEKQFIKEHPGPEPNSTLWPDSGKFQKDYDEAELRAFYHAFTVLDLQTIQKPTFKRGRKGTATNLWLVLQKPKTQV